MWAFLLIAASVLPGCSDYGLQGNTFTAPTSDSPTVELSAHSMRLDVGKAVVLSVKLANSGETVSPGTVLWKTSDTTVATVTKGGEIQAVGPGTATVTATPVGNTPAVVTTPATVTVTVPAAPSAPATTDSSDGPVIPGVTPELPRVTVDVSMPSGTGHSIQVSAGGDLQAAINSAALGDEILLPAGATFTGNFTLPAKSGSGWLIIRTVGTLPPAGTRVRPSNAGQMAKLVGADPTFPVIQTAPGAHNYRLIGLEITAKAGATQAYSLVGLGDGTGAQNTVSKVPHDLVLDRMYVHGTSSLNFQRCIALNSGSTAIVDSYISECHGKDMDSQAVGGWNGTGPYRIENDYLEAAGENVMFGGADPQIPNMLPRDIVIRRSHFYKPPEWKGVWEVKNLLEFKIGQRVLVDGNVFENCWLDAQDGTAVLFKSTNQQGTAPWSQTSDVTFQNNIVRNAVNAFSISAHPDPNPVVLAARIKVFNNLAYKIGDGDYTITTGGAGRMFVLSGIQGLIIAHNTAINTSNYNVVLTGAKVSHLVISDNIFGAGDNIIDNADGRGFGTTALNASADAGWIFRRNIVVGAPAASNPTDNFYPATTNSLGLDAGYNLPTSSLYRTAASDGSTIGANMAALNAAIAGVM
jgi:hypothetical protein